jgi:hypothetical protein
VVLLAAATEQDDVLQLVPRIIERYSGPDALDEQIAAGKYLASLHDVYLVHKETIESLDSKFSKLFHGLGYPDWLVVLSRNCE